MYLEYSEYMAMAGDKALISEGDYMFYEEVAETIIDAYTFSLLKKDKRAMADYGTWVKKAMLHQLQFMGGYKSLEAYTAESGAGIQSRSVNVGGTSESVTYRAEGPASHVNGLKVDNLAGVILAPLRARGRIIA